MSKIINDKFINAFNEWKKYSWKGRDNELAEYLGVSPQHISNIKSKKRNCGEQTRIKICNKIGIDYRTLIETGMPYQKTHAIDHNLIVQVNSQADKDRLNGISEYYRGIPLYESGRLSAGANGLIFDPYEEPSSTVIVYKSELQGHAKHNLRALRVGGDSMRPTIVQGAVIVVDLDDKAYADRRIFVVRTADMIAAVKRVGKWEKGFFLSSDNPEFVPEPTALDWHELCVGRVIWQWKDMRES